MKYRWRTIIPGAVYAHKDVGDDLAGDGTPSNPYQSLRKSLSLNPNIIVCYGTFTEDMADGNHVRTIQGDFYGAATFDGDDQFLIYGYTHIDFIIKNCIVGNSQLNVNTGSGLLAGAGRANAAYSVGYAYSVGGVAGSPVFMERTGLYWGVIGGLTALSNNIYSKIRANEEHPVSLGFRSTVFDNLTVYDCRIENRQKRITTSGGSYRYAIFSKFDFFADDAGVGFNTCLFTSDCRWYYNGSEITISGNNSAERLASLVAAMDVLQIPSEERSTFTNCIFSLQTAADIFNNPEKSDFTIKPGSDADLDIRLGGMPVAISVPILDNSNGVIGSWDENSATGCIEVMGDVIRLDEFSAALEGSILSKIIQINPLTTSINSILSLFSSKFNTGFLRLHREHPISDVFLQLEVMPAGTYVVEGAVSIEGVSHADNSIVEITSTSSGFTDVLPGSKMHLIGEFNYDVIYVRELSKITTEITSADQLQQGGIYLNHGAEDITYDGRVIVPGESFIAKNNVNVFSAPEGYAIAVMFDDTRAAAHKWIPAQMFGKYFTWRNGAELILDDRDIPISSGNDKSWQPVSDGGYSDVLVQHPLTRKYFQLGIFLKRFRV